MVILEGNECPSLMAVADGSQAWSLAAIEDKLWARRGRDKVFTSSRDLTEIERILAAGWNVSLSPWWLQPMPDERVFEGLRTFELAPAEARWSDTIPPCEAMGRLWWCYDVLWANGAVKRGEMDPGGFERIIHRWPFPINRAAWTKKVQAEWLETVELLIARMKKLDLAAARTPGQQVRELVQQAQRLSPEIPR